MLNVIRWDVTPEIIEGWKTPNWYGILFVTGLVLGYFVVKRMYKKEGISEDLLDKLVLYMVVGTIIGARLGHVLFYGPYWDVITPEGLVLERGYFSHPGDIIKIWEGGLASHGGAIAILIALIIYARKVIHKPELWVLDRLAAPIAIGGTFIRLGNLMNSEIVGDPTNVPWAFSFVHFWNDDLGMYDPTPRHPAQLYESLAYLITFVLLLYLYWKREKWKQQGFVFGTFLILLFGTRFLIEFVKLGQTARDEVLLLNTGQILSIPFVLAGVYLLFRASRNRDQVKS